MKFNPLCLLAIFGDPLGGGGEVVVEDESENEDTVSGCTHDIPTHTIAGLKYYKFGGFVGAVWFDSPIFSDRGTGICLGLRTKTLHGGEEGLTKYAVLWDRGGRDRIRVTEVIDTRYVEIPDDFDVNSALYVSIHTWTSGGGFSGLTVKLNGETGNKSQRGTAVARLFRSMDRMTKDSNPTPPNGCGFNDWGQIFNNIVVGPEEIKNPYAYPPRLRDPTKCVNMTRLMGFLTPTEHFVPIGSIPTKLMRNIIASDGSVNAGRLVTKAEDMVSVILDYKLGSLPSNKEIFRRDTLDPLVKYHLENPEHICPLKGCMYVDRQLNNCLYLKLYNHRNRLYSSWRYEILDQSLIGDIWREPEGYTFGGDLLEGVTIESIALTPIDEMVRVHVKNALGVRKSCRDKKTRFAGIRVISEMDPDDESVPDEWKGIWPTMAFSLDELWDIFEHLGIPTPSQSKRHVSKEEMCEILVQAKLSHDSGIKFRYQGSERQGSSSVDTLTDRLSRLESCLGDAGSKASATESSTESATATAGSANLPDEFLELGKELIAKSEGIRQKIDPSFKVATTLHRRTGHGNLPHRSSTKSDTVRKCSSDMKEYSQSLWSCVRTRGNLESMDTLTDKQRQMRTEFIDRLERMLDELKKKCGITPSEPVRRSKLPQRAEGHFATALYESELKDYLHHNLYFSDFGKRSRPDWLIVVTQGGDEDDGDKTYFLILELDENRHDSYYTFNEHRRLTYLFCAAKERLGEEFGGVDFIFWNSAETIEPHQGQFEMIKGFVFDRINLISSGKRGEGSNLYVFDYPNRNNSVYNGAGQEDGPKDDVNKAWNLNDHHMISEYTRRELPRGEKAPANLDWSEDADCRKPFLNEVKFYETPGFYPGEWENGE